METCYGVRLHRSMIVQGRKVPVSNYYVGRGKDGQVQTSRKPHNAALMTEALAELLVTISMPCFNILTHSFSGSETRTRDLCRDSLGIHVLSATYVLSGGCQSLKRTAGTVLCG